MEGEKGVKHYKGRGRRHGSEQLGEGCGTARGMKGEMGCGSGRRLRDRRRGYGQEWKKCGSGRRGAGGVASGAYLNQL